MEADQAEEKDEIEHYLRALRKKVEHQVRNPFDLAFANYSFEELATWKNNVLQLDATSRLYGQRVDFLHCGALQILGSVLNSEQAVQQSTQQRQEIKKQQAYDNAPYQKNLEIPQKISCQIERCDVSFTLWREIRKKRDALHQLMLNELPLSNTLSLMLIPQTATENIYEQIFQEDTAVYMKLLDFRVLSLKNMTIYQQIQEVSSSINIFMLNYCGKARGETTKVDSFMDFDFQYLDQDPFLDMQPQLDEGIRFAEISPLQLHEEQIKVDQELESSSQFAESEDYFEFDEESNTGKHKKGPKTNQKKREKATKKRQQESVDFKGMYLQRNLIILPQAQEIIQKFINPRDFLLLKFVKYGHPYAKRHKKHTTSKMRPNIERNVSYQEPLTIQQQPLTCQNPLDETFCWNPVTNISKMSQIRFKEAALPIKEMKRRIRQKVVIGPQNKLRFSEIKDAFASDQPLDIFISVLHIAAEEQALIVV